MADWKDKFQGGSFRGVPFKIESHELSGGRQRVDHEFPQRETGRSEDLGKRTQIFTLELLVIGDDYFAQRDALIEALEKEGPGELIHPYLGRKLVQAGDFSMSEVKSEGRMARFSVNFADSGEILFPKVSEDNKEAAVTAAENVQENSKSFFETAFSTTGQAAQVVQAAADDAARIGDQLDSAVKKVTEPVANLTFAIANYKSEIADLINKPNELASRIQDTFNALFDEFEDDPRTAERILGVFVGNFGGSFTPSVTNTTSSNKINDNQQAIINIGNLQALSVQSKAALDSDFISSNDALGVRDAIFDNLDDQLNITGLDDELFQNIKDLQAGLVGALPPQGLGDLITFKPVKTLPVIVISHKLFQNLDKEQEIIDQNAIQQPGFAPGGQEIEVSSG